MSRGFVPGGIVLDEIDTCITANFFHLFSTEYSLNNKKLCRAFSRQANRLTLNIPVLQGLLKVIGRLKKMRKVDKLKMKNYKC